jgi:ribosomal-protein-alanine N-acetyltransferase
LTTADRYARYVARCRTPQFVGLLVCRHPGGDIVGCVNLSEIVRGPFQSAYMGYHVFAPYAGQGYMRAALPLVLQVVFTTLELHRVEANIQPHNAPSIALVKGAGFTREGYSPRYLKVAGRWRDHERWALTVESWRAARSRRSS